MTNRYFLNKLKTSILALLCIVFVLSMSLFTLTACNDEEKTEDPEYSYTDIDEGLIANADFTKGTATKANDAYPIASTSDWTKAYHKQSISSYVDSGVVDVSSNTEKSYPWNKTIEKLKNDKDLLNALAYQDGATSQDSAKNKHETIKSELETKYFPNPGTHPGAVDGKIYMLNNYPQNQKYIGKGTAQSLTSSKSISLEKNKVAKISVWVKTANITGHGDPANRGANISLTNSINGKTQSQFRVTSIIAKDWTQYVLYVQGDSIYNSSLTLVLGLGFGLGSNVQTKYYTEGTAYFDDITCEILDNMPDNTGVTTETTGKLNIDSQDNCDVNSYLNPGKTAFLYDMTLDYGNVGATSVKEFVGLDDDDPTNYFTTSNVKDSDGNFTTSESISTKSSISKADVLNDADEKIGEKFTLVQASASVKTNTFTLDKGQYALINFNIINTLKAIGSTDISVDVWDFCEKVVDTTTGEKITTSKKIASIIAFDDISAEVVNESFLIYNNFPTDDDSFDTETRSFYVVLNIGPNDLSKVQFANDLATGEVIVKDFSVVVDQTPDNEEDDKAYDFIKSTTSVSKYLTAGYDGFTADSGYSKVIDSSTSYTLQTRPGDFGTIETKPANVKDYEGVTSNHSYVKQDGIETALNERSGDGKDGSYAGLINSKHLDNYKNLTNLADIANKIGSLTPDKDIQPLMIYNHTADSYGYVGEKITVDADNKALISVKVRVTDGAKAFIYLVDVSKTEKEILTFDSFTPTTSTSNKVQGTLNATNNKFEFVVDSMGSDEWKTISFYLATGKTEKTFRLEMWNGSRDNTQKSQGFVFFDEITTTTTNAFTESDKWENISTGHPLYDTFNKSLASTDVVVTYTQQLTDLERQFNEEYKNDANVAQVKYYENYVWVKTSTLLYAVSNTIDPIEKDPYTTIPEEDEESESGCAAETDPSTFWLSFSSILLGVCIVLAIIALILKFYLRKRKANRSDAVVHYNVTSRIRSRRDIVKEEPEQDEIEEEPVEEIEESTEEVQEEQTEQVLDDYVYGEVIEDFSEQAEEKNEEQSNDSEKNDSSEN